MRNTLTWDNAAKQAILQRVHAELLQGKPKIDWQTEYIMTQEKYQQHMKRVKKYIYKYGFVGLLGSTIYLVYFLSIKPFLLLISMAMTLLILLMIMWLILPIFRKQMIDKPMIEHIRVNFAKQKIEWLGVNQRVIAAQKFHTQAEIHALTLPENHQAQDRELRDKIQQLISQQTGVRFI